MMPPEAPEDTTGNTPPAASLCAEGASAPRARLSASALRPALEILRKRADFLRAANARRWGTGSMLVQARARGSDEGASPATIRVGYTCSKKLGNAVARNRAKRRLREAARAILPDLGRAGWDYVLIGKPEDTAAKPFDQLTSDLAFALSKLHDPDYKHRPRPPRKPRGKGGKR